MLSVEIGALLIDAASYAGRLALRVVPMMVTAVFVAEFARLWFGEDRLRSILTGRHSISGRLRAAVLGASLPFCECGAFPVMLGLIRAGLPAGVVLTFFLVSPVVSMPAFMILIAVFGLQLAISYLFITMTTAILAGFLLEKAGGKWGMFKEGIAVYNENRTTSLVTACGQCCPESAKPEHCCDQGDVQKANKGDRRFVNTAGQALVGTKLLLKKILPYMVAVIIISAFLQALVPRDLIESTLAARAPFDILLGALAGIPIYAGDCAMIALVAPLIGATGAVGAGIAFIISGSATSISGIIFMSSVFKRRFLYLYILVVFFIALIAGYFVSTVFAFTAL